MNPNVKIFVQQGIKVFACLPDKAPAVHLGFHAATLNMDGLQRQFTQDNFLIGLATGNVNKLVVIDFDIGKKIPGTDDIDQRTVEELMAEVEEQYGPLPDTFSVETKGKGRHLYYKVPFTSLTSKRRFLDDFLPVDIRANGGYVCTIDDINYTKYDDVNGTGIENILAECAMLPEWVTAYKKKHIAGAVGTTKSVETLPPEEIRELRSALAFLSSDDRDLWIKIGMALKSTGSVSAYGLWNEWSKTSEKYNPEEMEKRWTGLKPSGDVSMSTVFYEAQQLGWVTTYNQAPANTKKSNTINKTTQERKPFPEDLLRPDGFVGELIDYIGEHSIKPQPILALGAALAATGALEGRKIQTDKGIRTNIYAVGVGVSGCGKEAARKCIKDLFYYAGCGELASVEDIASDASILTSLNLPGRQSQIFLLDEIGRFLKTTNQAQKSPHLYNIISVLLKLYSNANQIFYGKAYADSEKQIQIENPNLCIYGTTVPEVMYRGLTLDSVTDGFLSRMIIFESEDPDPPRNKCKSLTKRPPKEMIETVKRFLKKPVNASPDGNLDQFHPNPQIVPISSAAHDMLDEFTDWISEHRAALRNDNRFDSIYNRTPQIAEQIALIIAGGIDIENPVITESEMSYGIRLSHFLSDHMMYITENFIADNEYHHNVKRILKIIREHESVTLSMIASKVQDIPKYIRNEILDVLKDSEQIVEETEGIGHHKKRIFRAI